MLKELQVELTVAQSKLEAIRQWLVENTQHPDFCKVASDRNYWSVRIQSIEYKINQVTQGKPSHGEPEELKSEVDFLIAYQTGKINI